MWPVMLLLKQNNEDQYPPKFWASTFWRISSIDNRLLQIRTSQSGVFQSCRVNLVFRDDFLWVCCVSTHLENGGTDFVLHYLYKDGCTELVSPEQGAGVLIVQYIKIIFVFPKLNDALL